ncbi:uncharacterized protein LOC118438638 [Folsomia candida]|uniref:uncharacterized protein LOC118438638 n=1 Tax=Folsomia candida TaxID=158441 RepID=UPI001605513D|nr:uncharacterized protein LOC118438638 [Folsomia candida]
MKIAIGLILVAMSLTASDAQFFLPPSNPLWQLLGRPTESPIVRNPTLARRSSELNNACCGTTAAPQWRNRVLNFPAENIYCRCNPASTGSNTYRWRCAAIPPTTTRAPTTASPTTAPPTTTVATTTSAVPTTTVMFFP